MEDAIFVCDFPKHLFAAGVGEDHRDMTLHVRCETVFKLSDWQLKSTSIKSRREYNGKSVLWPL
jgi:hypothetical protein